MLANKLFGSAKATFWRQHSLRVENEILQGYHRQHTALGLRELDFKSKEAHALRVFRFRCLRGNEWQDAVCHCWHSYPRR